jgi:hypothetical protein
MRIARFQSRPIGHRPALLAVLLATVALASAPAALADVGETIIQRCTHGQSLAGFSPGAYSRALKELSADAEEYTDCAALIRQAQLAAASHNGAGGGAGAPGAAAVATVATPTEKRSIAHAASAGSGPVRLDGGVVHPGVVHASIASALSTLPTPLLAILALMLACLLIAAGTAVRRRVRAGRPD